jgi:hypothetical protein
VDFGRITFGILGNCPVGRLAIGIATDICRYRPAMADARATVREAHISVKWIILSASSWRKLS